MNKVMSHIYRQIGAVLHSNNIFPELDEVFLCTRYGIRKLENREVDNIFQQSKNEIRTVPGTLIFV